MASQLSGLITQGDVGLSYPDYLGAGATLGIGATQVRHVVQPCRSRSS